MFTFQMGRNGTRHKRGFVFRSPSLDSYLLMHFRTDFFLEVNGQVTDGHAGDWVLHRPGSRVAHGPLSQRESFVNDWLFFSAEEQDIPWLEQMPHDIPIPGGPDELFSHCLSDIIGEQIRGDQYSAQLISDHICWLLCTLHRTHAAQLDHSTPLHAQFQHLRTHILTQCNEPWTLMQMAERSGYSVSRFCDLYKQFFHKSPMDDLLDERLVLAKRLLALQSYSVGEVATLCGFSSLHYFSAFFKKRTGHAPSDY